MAVLHEVADEVAQREQLRATLDQRDAVHAEAGLHGGHLEELVQHHPAVGITLHVYHDAHSVAVALVVGVVYALYLLLLHQLCDILDELLLVHSVGYLGHHYLVVCVACLDVGLGAHDDASASGLVCVLDALQSHDVASGGEVGTLDILHERLHVHLGIIYECHACVYHLSQVVCGYVGGHTHGYACGSVEQQVGQLGGHHGRLLQGVVEVVGHIYGLLVQVVHHGLAHEAQSCLGVSHGGGAVAIHASEVALPIHQRVSHGPLLCHAHECEIYGAVAVGVELTEHFTHDTCTLLVWSAVQVAHLLHAEEDAPVHRLESVSHIGQCACHYHAHGVVDVALPHLVLDVNFDNSFLIFHSYLILSVLLSDALPEAAGSEVPRDRRCLTGACVAFRPGGIPNTKVSRICCICKFFSYYFLAHVHECVVLHFCPHACFCHLRACRALFVRVPTGCRERGRNVSLYDKGYAFVI